MTQSHLLRCFRDTLWLLPVHAERASRLDGTETTTACADAPQDHKGGCFMPPTFTNIGATRLLAHSMQGLAAHELLELIVVLPFRGTHPEPFWSALWDDGRHGNVLYVT